MLVSRLEIGGELVEVDLSAGIDLSIPLAFADTDPSLYGVPHASEVPFEAEGLIGDTRLGGSCNVSTIALTPHCHGTHTECVGHITHARHFIADVLPTGLMPGRIVSVSPEPVRPAGESSIPAIDSDSALGITARSLKVAGLRETTPWNQALILRTLPNSPAKKTAKYADNSVPFFTIEAIEYLRRMGVEHILVDLPSLDRLHDDGHMAAHRAWWNVEMGAFDLLDQNEAIRTVTELIFVPDDATDGVGLVAIHVPPFQSDAAPSRPIFYPALRRSTSNASTQSTTSVSF